MDKIFQKQLQKRSYYLEKIKKFFFTPFVKVLIGQRRVGKSSLLIQTLQCFVNEKEVSKEDIFYMNKEYPDFDDIKTYQDLNTILIPFIEKDENYKVIALDEIQEIENWEKSINGILSKYEKVDIYITGSNSHLLSGELATLLSGRYVEIPIFPMTYQETKEVIQNSHLSFLEYLQYGWLPEVYFQKDEDVKFSYLQSVYHTIILKDVISRNQIKNLHFFSLLYKYIFKSIGNIFSAKNISDYLKSQKIDISVNSVLEYLKYGEFAFVLNQVKSQEIKTKKLFTIHNKYYVGDLGVRNALVWFKTSEDIWWILENYVYLVLRKYGYTITIGRIQTYDVDFIAEKQGKLMYFQVATSIMDDTTREREYYSLQQIHDNRPKYVVSMDDFDFWVSEGIQHLMIQNLEEIL